VFLYTGVYALSRAAEGLDVIVHVMSERRNVIRSRTFVWRQIVAREPATPAAAQPWSGIEIWAVAVTLSPADAVFSLEDLTTRLGSHRNNTACGAVSMA
jgi:hypothetical protein